MANLDTNYHAHYYPDLGVTLKRFYIGPDAEYLGTVARWKREIDELYNQMPHPEFWRNLKLEVWDMAHPDLLNGASPTLKDYDLKTPGYQTAVGLHFGGERIALGYFKERGIEYSIKALSHEVGHWYADQAGYGSNTWWGREFRGLFNEIRPHQTENEHEDFAEVYRAILGSNQCRGYFSDDKAFYPTDSLKTLIKCALPIADRARYLNISSLKVMGTWVKLTVKTGFWPLERTQYFAVTQNWDWFEWTGSKWKQL